jgi:hypothetical protein
MARTQSLDVRERVVAAVPEDGLSRRRAADRRGVAVPAWEEASEVLGSLRAGGPAVIEDGLSRQQAADRFGIAASTAVLRIDRQRELGSAATAGPGCDHRIGSAAASAMGGDTAGEDRRCVRQSAAPARPPVRLHSASTRPRTRLRPARRGQGTGQRTRAYRRRSLGAGVRPHPAAIVQVGARPRPNAIIRKASRIGSERDHCDIARRRASSDSDQGRIIPSHLVLIDGSQRPSCQWRDAGPDSEAKTNMERLRAATLLGARWRTAGGDGAPAGSGAYVFTAPLRLQGVNALRSCRGAVAVVSRRGGCATGRPTARAFVSTSRASRRRGRPGTDAEAARHRHHGQPPPPRGHGGQPVPLPARAAT